MASAYPTPIGGAAVDPAARRNAPIQFISGQPWSIRIALLAPDGSPAVPENSRVVVTLRDQVFSGTDLWTGSWGDGVTTKDGVAVITVPRRTTDTLRRGAYVIGVAVGEQTPDSARTIYPPVYVELDYVPGSATTTIPYHEE